MKYIIITPVKNEEKYIEYTLKSVCAQTLKPKKWIIVNDGSKDKTAEIVEKYTKNNSWINLINNETVHEKRAIGPKVVRAFYVGYHSIKNHDYDFIVKLDGDLSFESVYFEKLFEEFKKNPRLGIAGGECYMKVNGKLKLEKTASDHVRGLTKVYRRECYQAIGGLLPTLGWDGIDEMKAQMKGWKTKGFKKFKVIHHRPTGKEGGLLRTRINNGKEFYVMGYHPIFMLVRTIYKIFERPYIIGSILTLVSFIKCYFNKNINHIDDKELIKFIRRKQINRLLFKDTER